MILSKHDLLAAQEEHRIIDPTPPTFEQVSVNLHLGRKFTRFKKLSTQSAIGSLRPNIALFDEDRFFEDSEADESFELRPGELVLAQTMETIRMPPHLMGLVEGRSSWGRSGIVVHLTAPKIDPGFKGPITLEMVNLGRNPMKVIPEEDEPAQLILLQLSTPLEPRDLYGEADADLFQYQIDPRGRQEG